VFQRRLDGSVDFFRTWNEYSDGFGNLNGEFWLGNRLINEITTQRSYKMKAEAVAFDGSTFHVFHTQFYLDSQVNNYTIRFDVKVNNNTSATGVAPKNYPFSTWDRDNDIYAGNCAQSFLGAWWYTSCHGCNFNGFYYPGGNHSQHYASGVDWSPFKGQYESMKATWMMISRM
ncbi:hypothetical protein HELRODRAFT_74951, partial [Helobdella robusta]|uniref:Fibrinogen C-terminal domain-containing protein n=1 Tax=Helobdella robusta TaxID=6412 RepID=T1G1Y4_HELRO